MFITKKKGLLLSGLILVAIILVALMFSVPSKTASAETVSDILNYTLVTDSQGNDSYSVSIKSAAKPTTDFVVVPEKYNGKPKENKK